jgi:hypothetical protein
MKCPNTPAWNEFNRKVRRDMMIHIFAWLGLGLFFLGCMYLERML